MDIQKTLNQSVEQGAVHGVIAAAAMSIGGGLCPQRIIWVRNQTAWLRHGKLAA